MTDHEDQATPAMFSRESGLVLDREGSWTHRGEPVSHPLLEAALHRWVDRDEATGRFVIRAGTQWAFIEVEDCPFVVRGLTLDGEGLDRTVTLRLSDGSEEELDYGSLEQDSGNVLRSAVKGGRFRARFARPAYYALALHAELDDDESATLPARGQRWPIRVVGANRG
jgi:uncharacterized protein